MTQSENPSNYEAVTLDEYRYALKLAARLLFWVEKELS